MADNGISLVENDGIEVVDEKGSPGIKVQAMQFSYESDSPLFVEFNLQIGSGSRCLLVGANGSGISIIVYFSLFLVWFTAGILGLNMNPMGK